MDDQVLSAKYPDRKGVVTKDCGINDPEPYQVKWADESELASILGNWLKPADIVRMPPHQLNVDPNVQEYLKNGQISQVVSGGQVCVCVFVRMRMCENIMHMRPLNSHAHTNAYTCVYTHIPHIYV